MHLRKLLLAEHSKTQTGKVVKYIGNDSERFKELIKLFLGQDYKITQRAAWPLGILGELYPELIKPYFAKLINNLDQPVHDAVKRNTMRVFQYTEIPTRYMGKLTEKSFYYLTTPSEPIAVRVFAMTVLLHIVKQQPELKKELKIILEDQLPYASTGFVSRAKKTLKELEKIN